MRILGIDQSLTGTGFAVIEDGSFQVLERLKPKTVGHERLALIKARVLELAADADVVAMEQPTFSMRRSASTGALFGLKEVLAHALWEHGKEPVYVNPMHRAQYATGKGNAGKDEVLLAGARRYGDERLSNNDIVDAALIAAMVARIVGHPLEGEAALLTSDHTDALVKVEMTGAHEDLVAPENAEDRAWRAVEKRVSRPVLQALRALDGASPQYANALIDYALERGYEVYQTQRWVTCTRRLTQPSHTCGAKKCSGEWATPADWEHPVLLRLADGEGWAILSQDRTGHGLPAPVGDGRRAHLHTAFNEFPSMLDAPVAELANV